MKASSETGGTLNNAAKSTTAENNVVIKVEPLTQLTIQSPPHGQIEIQAGDDIASIQTLKFVRHGDNLEIYTEDGTRAAVIIEGYYAQETPPDIYGIDEQGNRYTWSSIGATSLVSALTDGETSVQEASAAQEGDIIAQDAATEAKQDNDDDKGAAGLFGMSAGWTAAAAGLAAAAIAGGVIAATSGGNSDDNNSNSGNGDGGNGGDGSNGGDGGNGGDGSNGGDSGNGGGATAPTGTLSNIQFINDNDPANPTIISNGITNDTTPVITGHVEGAEKGDRVVIKDGDKILGYAEIDTNGNWSFSPLQPLNEGAHQITAELQDAEGNSGDSQQIDLTIDITAPGEAGNIHVDGKPADGENITGDNTPTIGGDAEPGSTITITDDKGNVIGSAVADDDGHWEITPDAPLDDGNHDLTIDVTDPAGNNTSSDLPINIDTMPPNGITNIIVTNDDNEVIDGSKPTNDSTPTFSGKVEGDDKGDYVIIKDKGEVIGTAVVNDDGSWTYTPEQPLGDGEHQITATPADKAGNEGTPSSQVDYTQDTVPPAAAGDITVDGAPIDPNTPIENNKPVIGGSAEPGSTVTITDDKGNVIGSAVADDDGHWDITPDTELGNGENNLDVTVTDPAGNSTSSTIPPISIDGAPAGGDTTPPTGTLSDIELINDNDPDNPVAIEQGGLTNDATPTITGKVNGAEPGDRVVIKQGDDILGTATINDDGSWTYTPTTPLGEGSNELTVELQDAAGNAGAAVSVSVVIDTEAPVAAGDITVDGAPIDPNTPTANNKPVIGGSAEPGSTVTITDGEGNVIGSVVVSDDGSWEITPDNELGAGSSDLVITVTDPAGNSTSSDQPINIGEATPPADTTPPTGTLSDIELINDNDPDNPVAIEQGGLTNDATPTITGKVNGAEPGDRVVIKQGDDILGTATINDDGSWTYTPTTPLGEGSNELTVELQDAAGNAGAAVSVSVVIDTEAPVAAGDITVDGAPIDPNTPTANNKPVIGGSAEPGSTVTITDGEGNVIGSVVVSDDGSWEITPDNELGAGSSDLVITVTDPAGNSTSSDQPINIGEATPPADTTPPTGTLSDIELINDNDPDNPVAIEQGGLTNDATPTITGKVNGAEPGDRVVIKQGDDILGTATINDDGSWTYTPTTPLGEGSNELTVELQDAAGNAGAAESVSVIIDTEAPAAADNITVAGKPADSENLTNDSTPTIGGNAEPGSTVTIKDGTGNVIGTAVVGDDGKWEITPDSALPENGTNLVITVTDPAGNSSAPSELPVNVDTTPPEAATDIKVTNDVTDTDVTTGGVTNDNTPTISGKAEVGSTVNILDKDGNIIASTTADANGDWSAQIPTELADDVYNDMHVQVVDQAGNESQLADVPHFSVDTTNTNTTTITTDAQASDPQPTFSGKVEFQQGDSKDNVTVTIKDKNGVIIAENIAVNADGSWTYTPSEALPSGAHNISAVVVDDAQNESQPGYLNGTEDGGWTIPAVLYSDATQPAGDLFGYSMMVSDSYIYISAPYGGLNSAEEASQQGIIYAVKKEFAYLLDGSASIEKLFAEHSDMGTIITNNSDMYGDGQVDAKAVQGYGMKVLVDGWVAIYSHFIDTVYFVKEPLSPDFDLADITNAPGGHSDQGFLVNGDQWNHYVGFNVSGIKNADGTLTFLIGDIAGPSTERGSINTVTFNPDPDGGNWGNVYLTESPTNDRYLPWIPKGDLPEGMEVGGIGMEDWELITQAGGTLQTGDTTNYNFGSDIVNVGDIFGNGHQYVAIQDAEALFYNQAGRGTWYLYQVPEGGIPNNFSIGNVPEDQLIRINNIGEGYLNELSWAPTGDAGSGEFNTHTHNLAILDGFNGGTDIAIGSAGDTYNQSNGKVWILHADKIDSNIVNIGINGTTSKFDTDKGYGIISTNHPSGYRQGFGLNVIGGHDFNGDGNNDLVITDPLALNDKGQAVGAVYIVYGGYEAEYQQYLTETGEINIQTILDNGWGEVHYGSVPGQFFGWSVDVLDMNNDNTPDLLVGAPSQTGGYVVDSNTGELTNNQYNGQVYVVYNTHTAPAEDIAPNSRSFSLDEQNPHDDGGIPLLLDGDHQNVDLAALTDALQDTHSIDISNGDNTLKVNNQTLDSWEGAEGDALIVNGENGNVELTGGADNWHSNGTVTVDGKVYQEYQSSGMAEVLIEDRIHVNIL